MGKTPRHASTYRGARRNAVIHPEKPEKPGVWRGITPKFSISPTWIRLNRSRKWRPIEGYEDGPGRIAIQKAS